MKTVFHRLSLFLLLFFVVVADVVVADVVDADVVDAAVDALLSLLLRLTTVNDDIKDA